MQHRLRSVGGSAGVPCLAKGAHGACAFVLPAPSLGGIGAGHRGHGTLTQGVLCTLHHNF